ncbi:MAG: membrane protein insertase YidC [Proteobacteria bacterium]|nr:membrane protein insertase YidC [Pseudomonadota bacterium]
MEQSRFIIAVALSFVVFLVWNHFYDDTKDIKPVAEIVEVQQTNEKESSTSDNIIKSNKKYLQIDTPAYEELKPARVINIKTPLYSVSINEKNAAITSFKLLKYNETIDVDSPNKELISKDIKNGTVIVGFDGKSVAGIENANYISDIGFENIVLDQGSKEIKFYWKSPEGIIIEKKYQFSADTYLVGLKVNIINQSSELIKDKLFISLESYDAGVKNTNSFEGPTALINGSLEQIKLKNIEDKNNYPGTIKWVSAQDRYFMSAVIPITPMEATMRLYMKDKEKGHYEAQYLLPEKEIRPGVQEQIDFNLFFGPKSLKLLGTLGYDLSKAVNFGWFDFLAKPVLYAMNFLYGVIPNYGVVIIILTVLFKVLFWPLGSKSYKSMNEMKKIQPLLAELKEKYGNDKKRMNEELMGLYKTYKINPMGGCLPMVAQLPVFFAFYRMLYETIELRHAPFVFWIKDLAAPDRLFHFGFSVPFMEPPYGIPVLTIIMGATMFIQQKMTPAVGDPAQAKMMMFLPIIFTVIFINFSAGLVLYWLVNNVLSILQQHIISRKTA